MYHKIIDKFDEYVWIYHLNPLPAGSRGAGDRCPGELAGLFPTSREPAPHIRPYEEAPVHS